MVFFRVDSGEGSRAPSASEFQDQLAREPQNLSALPISPSKHFKLSEPSAYTNGKVLLLTKMDLTEFRS